MLEAGSYRIRVGDLVVDEDNEMWLEIELRERPFGTLVVPMGPQPMTREEQESVRARDACEHYLRLKFGIEDAEKYINSRIKPNEWWERYVSADGEVLRYEMYTDVMSWLRKEGNTGQ